MGRPFSLHVLETQWQKLGLQEKMILLGQMTAIKRGLYDSAFFCRYWLGIEVNPFQERTLLTLDEAMWGGKYKMEDLIEAIMKAGNRTGKTVLLAMLHIKFAYYKLGIEYGNGYEDFKYRTFAISPISRQAKECLKYIEDILVGRLTWTIKGKRYSNAETLKLRDFFVGKNEALGELRYANRSVTYAFSTGADQGENLQGVPAGLVTYDECVLSHHLETELDSNIYSRLGDYGKMMLLVSTPNEEGSSQQYFYHLSQEARKGENNFLLFTGSYLENIFISEAKRQSHVQTVMDRDPIMAKQILYGDFVSTGGSTFDNMVIENMWTGQKKPQPANPDHEYMISADWGVADTGDETVFLVWDVTMAPFKIDYAYSRKGGDPYELMAVLRNLKIEYNDAEIVMDTGSMGGTIFKKLLRDLKPISFEAAGALREKGNAITYSTMLLTKNRNRQLVNNEYVEMNPNYGWIRSYYLPKLATQMATYKLDDRKLKQDWVSAFYIGCWRIFKKYGDKQNQVKSLKLNPFKINMLS